MYVHVQVRVYLHVITTQQSYHLQRPPVMTDPVGMATVQGEVSQLLSAIRRGGHWSGLPAVSITECMINV